MIRQPIFLCLLSLFAPLVCFQQQATSAVVVDQQQLLNNGELVAHTEQAAQSIIPTFNNIVGVRLGISNSPTTITVGIFDSLTNPTTALESKTVTPVGNSFHEVIFDTPVNVTAGNTYFLVARVNGPTGGFRGVITDQYAGGNAATVFAHVNGSGEFVTTGVNTNFPGFDMEFATLSDNAVTATPEPSSFVILVGAMIGSIVRRRRSSGSAN